MHKFLLSFTLCFPLLAQVAPPNSIGVSMGHYHIVTSDAEAQKRLWIGALGGKLVKSGALEYAMFPGVLIGFRKGESSGGTEGSIVDHIAFAVRSAASVREKLSAAGARIIKESADKRQFLPFSLVMSRWNSLKSVLWTFPSSTIICILLPTIPLRCGLGTPGCLVPYLG